METMTPYELISLMEGELNNYISWMGIIAAIVIVAVTGINIWMFNSAVKRKLKDQKKEFEKTQKEQKLVFENSLNSQNLKFEKQIKKLKIISEFHSNISMAFNAKFDGQKIDTAQKFINCAKKDAEIIKNEFDDESYIRKVENVYNIINKK